MSPEASPLSAFGVPGIGKVDKSEDKSGMDKLKDAKSKLLAMSSVKCVCCMLGFRVHG